MRTCLIMTVAFFAISTAVGRAQDIDRALLSAGEAIYNDTCFICHGDNGEGNPPIFPALKGNANLGELDRIVGNIFAGRGNMPPFPDLKAEQIAAVATYIRNSWSNEWGGVGTAQVATILKGLEAGVAQRTVWDAVFTQAQAKRGKTIYSGVCATCHGRRLNGAPEDPDMISTPPVARLKFLRNWNGQSMATLFEFTRATMPISNPGYMSDQDYIDTIAYMLASSNLPAGETDLSTEPTDLARIVITKEP